MIMPNPKIRFIDFTDDWEQRKFSDIADIKTGPFGSTLHAGDYVDDGTPIITTEHFKNGSLPNAKENLPQVSDEDYKRLSSYILNEGDIVFSRVGSVDINAVTTRLQEGWLFSGRVLRARPKDSIDSIFMHALLETETVKKNIRDRAVGQTMPSINTEILGVTPLVFPQALEEQTKIGKVFSELDNLITLHQRKCDETKELKNYMLQKMFPKNGEKVPEIRFAGFTDDWEQRKVSEVAEIVAGGTPSTKISNYWEPKEVPWLSSGEVHKKYITFTDNMISQEGMNNSSAKMIKENSVLIALAGQGKTRGTVAINRIPLTTNQSIAAMTFNDDIVPEFIFCNLENRYDEIRKMSSGDGARGGLNKQLVGDIEIPYTSYEEQKKIGTYFEQLDNHITLHQRKYDNLKELKKYMLQNMFPTKG